MSLETLLRRHFGLLVLALVATMAYFQARGLSHLVVAGLIGPSASATSSSSASPRLAPSTSARSADPILSRNPFDSVTGPIRETTDLEVTEEEEEEVDPLSVPECEKVKALIVTESTTRADSMATLQVEGEKTPKLCFPGDRIGDKTLVHIGYNRSKASSAVWLYGSDTLCQALVHPRAAASTTAKPNASSPPPKTPRHTPAPPEIVAKIEKVSNTEFRIDRSAFRSIMENKLEWLRARVTPENKDGKTVGMRLRGVRKESLLRNLGLMNQDRLDAINGRPLNSVGGALQAFQSLSSVKKMSLRIERNGKPMTLEYDIE